jgi:hypothetical protein
MVNTNTNFIEILASSRYKVFNQTDK